MNIKKHIIYSILFLCIQSLRNIALEIFDLEATLILLCYIILQVKATLEKGKASLDCITILQDFFK